MGFDEALDQELKTISAFANRIYPLTSLEASKKNGVPYCIYVSSSGVRDKELNGYQEGKSVSGEVNVIAARYVDLKSIADEVIDLLVSFEQRTIGTDGPFIQELTYEDPVTLYEEKPDLYRCHIPFEVYF